MKIVHKPPLICVVMASYNRRDVTLAGIASLYNLDGRGTAWHLQVVLLDDASPDGTAQAVKAKFPEVTVLHGTGNLFWGGGMHAAMIEALKTTPDFTVLYNDDVILFPSAMSQMLADYDKATLQTGDPKQVIVGAVTDPATGQLTYSGFVRAHLWDPSKLTRIAPSNSALTPCDTMNGNFVLVPRAVTRIIGPVDPSFVQQLGDLDYGYRARRAGASIWLARGTVGTCAPNLRPPPWRKPGLGLLGRWRALNTPHGLPLRSWVTFMWRWGGPVALARLAGIYALRILGVK